MAPGSAQKDFSRTSPCTPKPPAMAPTQVSPPWRPAGSAMAGPALLGRGLGGGFGGRLGGGLVGAGLGALERVLAGLALLRVRAGLLLGDAGGLEETGDAVGLLRTLAEPVLHPLEVELDAALVVLGEEGVVGAELLD